MKILIFDTETTGLPISYTAPLINSDLWPYIIQLSYILYDTNRHTFEYADNIIKLDNNIIISEESINIHGITGEKCREKGRKIEDVLTEFSNILQTTDILIAHNINFDKNIIMVEYLRNNMSHNFSPQNHSIPQFCTMKESIELCNIVRRNKYGQKYKKYPKLIELHQHLFNETPANLHNAMTDVIICLRCYMKMQYNIDIYEYSTELNNLLKTYI